MVHDLDRQFLPVPELQNVFPTPVNIMVAGHTHEEHLEVREGVLILNSGSITFPHQKELRLGTVGLLELKPGWLSAEIIPLGETIGRPNPGQPFSLEVQLNGSEPQVTMQTPDAGRPSWV